MDKEKTLIALQETLEMWQWLERTGEPDKLQYFIQNKADEDIPWNACYLCEACTEFVNGRLVQTHCEECPVLWGAGTQDEVDGIYCEKTGSLYRSWRKCPESEKSHWAGEIVDRVQSAIIRAKKNN